MKKIYKVVQNYLSSNEYEYSYEYDSICDAIKTISEYELQDIQEGVIASYTVIDENYDDAIALEREKMRMYNIAVLGDIGISKDEYIAMFE